MTDSTEKYKDSIKKARDIVEELKLVEPYKTNAFNALLSDLLTKKTSNFSGSSLKFKEQSPEIKEEINSSLDFSEVPFFENFDKLDWKSKLLHILQWAKNNHPAKGLITSEFVKIFSERFGMPYIDSSKINKELTRRLIKTPLATRKKINQRDFVWFITPKGEDYLKRGHSRDED